MLRPKTIKTASITNGRFNELILLVPFFKMALRGEVFSVVKVIFGFTCREDESITFTE